MLQCREPGSNTRTARTRSHGSTTATEPRSARGRIRTRGLVASRKNPRIAMPAMPTGSVEENTPSIQCLAARCCSLAELCANSKRLASIRFIGAQVAPLAPAVRRCGRSSDPPASPCPMHAPGMAHLRVQADGGIVVQGQRGSHISMQSSRHQDVRGWHPRRFAGRSRNSGTPAGCCFAPRSGIL